MSQSNVMGTFTQVPNVIYDRCNLPAEVIYTFEKLYRLLGHKGGKYTGSYSKLAEVLRLSKNKTGYLESSVFFQVATKEPDPLSSVDIATPL